jgi:hypothetical protein
MRYPQPTFLTGREKNIFLPLCCLAMNNVQQSTTVKLSVTPWQHSGLLRKFLTARIFSKLVWIKRHFDKGMKILREYFLLQTTEK